MQDNIKINGINTENRRDIANAFNNFFVNVAAKSKDPVSISCTSTTSDSRAKIWYQ